MASMYTGRETSPQKGFPMSAPKHTEEKAKACLWCQKTLIKPRSNQSYCNAECRKSHKAQKRMRNDKPVITRKCETCATEFEPKKPTQLFCSTTCQQVWNNFWKGKGPKIAKSLFDWRVKRVPGGLTQLGRDFAQARDDWKDKKKQL